MFKALGRYAARRPWPICAAWGLVALAVTLIAPNWDNRVQDDDIRFLPARCDSVRGYRLLEQAFPQDVYASTLLFAVERPDGPLSDADLALVDDVVGDLTELHRAEPGVPINRVVSHRDPFVGPRLISADRKCTLIRVSLGTPYLALQTQATVDRASQVVRKRLETATDGPVVYATGLAGIGHDLVTVGGSSLDKTTVATVLLVVFILLAVYRAPLLALVPLVTIAASVWVALKVLALCTLIPGFYLVNISQIFAIVMLYGAGTDYCLFLISRYREELGQGHAPPAALRRSVGSVSGALAASAATVICGLGLMGLAEFAKVRCAGPAIAVSLAVALIASLTLAPALLRLLGGAVFWPVGVRLQPRIRDQGLWGRVSKAVVARPMAIWGVAVAVLLPLAWLGLTVKSNYRATGELDASSSSIKGLEAIKRHFTAGEVGPVTLLLDSANDWDNPQGRRVLEHLSHGLGYLDNVAEVRSLTQPLGPDALASAQCQAKASRSPLLGAAGSFGSLLTNLNEQVEETARKAARSFYEAEIPTPAGHRYVTRLDVVLKADPFDPRSVPTLELLQAWLRDKLPCDSKQLGDVRAEIYGVTANARDLALVTENDRVRIDGLVLAGTFLILLALVRRPWLAAYLLVTVLLSYFATLGATTLMAHWWFARPLGEIDWRVPFFLFTILVAVGEDYNILLITRALQEKKRHGTEEGLRRALARTGGTITSCGVIMAGTFATLMLAGLNTLIQIGFALAFGVLLDTFLVRPFLVPTFTLWIWRRSDDVEPSEAIEEKPAPRIEIRRAA
jgi:RND superfamily putative drug exporter